MARIKDDFTIKYHCIIKDHCAIKNHEVLGRDWCHICGERSHQSADIWYRENLGPKIKSTRYVRICAECAKRIFAACTEYQEE